MIHYPTAEDRITIQIDQHSLNLIQHALSERANELRRRSLHGDRAARALLAKIETLHRRLNEYSQEP